MKAIALYPGVANGVEGTSGLYVRGGSPDQNLILIDGSTVYNTNHFFGFLSVFNPSAVNALEIYKSGIPTKYGTRIGGVINVNVYEGNKIKKTTENTIGLLSSSIMKSGPLKSNNNSYFIAARLSNSALLSLFTIPQYNNATNPFLFGGMYDINAKINFALKNKGRLYASAYLGDDLIYTKEKVTENQEDRVRLTWGNKTLSLRYYNTTKKGAFINTLLNYSIYHYTNYFNSINSSQIDFFENKSILSDFSLKQQFSKNISGSVILNGGVEGQRQSFSPNQIAGTSTTKVLDTLLQSIDNTLTTNSFAGFIQADFNINPSLVVNIGLRNQFYYTGKLFTFLEPRLKINSKINNQLSLFLSYDKMTQNIHLLSTTGIGLSNDIWLPATQYAPPSESQQLSVGTHITLLKNMPTLNIEAYYRKMNNLVDYREGNSLFSAANLNWENLLETNGEGTAYGIEFFLEKEAKNISWFLSYTYARSFRNFEYINNGNTFAFSFDRPHDIAFSIHKPILDNWTLSSTFIYQSGRPFTAPNSIIEGYIDAGSLLSYTARNNANLPSYHRLDVSVSNQYTNKKGKEVTLTFGCYNIYNRRNVIGAEYGLRSVNPREMNADRKVRYNSRALFGIVPSFSYTAKF
jgi:outer membrane receptor for ferrienterochelin and colicin